MKKANPDEHYDWIVSPDSFLAIALLGCNSYPGIFKELGFRSHHPDTEFIYPIIFNFKQGIELYIKGLGIIDYHEEYEGKHDIKFLIEKNIEKAKGTKSEKTWNQLNRDIWPVVKKYYFGTYIPPNIDENHPDIQNEAERYPEAKNNQCYKIPAAFEWMSQQILKMVKDDILITKKFLEQAKRDIMNIQRIKSTPTP